MRRDGTKEERREKSILLRHKLNEMQLDLVFI